MKSVLNAGIAVLVSYFVKKKVLFRFFVFSGLKLDYGFRDDGLLSFQRVGVFFARV